MGSHLLREDGNHLEGAVDIPAEEGEAVHNLRGEVAHTPQLQGAAGDILQVQGSHQWVELLGIHQVAVEGSQWGAGPQRVGLRSSAEVAEEEDQHREQRIQVHREGLLEEIQQGEESPVPRLEGDIRQEQGDSLLPQEGEGNPREQGDSHRVRL